MKQSEMKYSISYFIKRNTQAGNTFSHSTQLKNTGKMIEICNSSEFKTLLIIFGTLYDHKIQSSLCWQIVKMCSLTWGIGMPPYHEGFILKPPAVK